MAMHHQYIDAHHYHGLKMLGAKCETLSGGYMLPAFPIFDSITRSSAFSVLPTSLFAFSFPLLLHLSVFLLFRLRFSAFSVGQRDACAGYSLHRPEDMAFLRSSCEGEFPNDLPHRSLLRIGDVCAAFSSYGIQLAEGFSRGCPS